MEEYPYRVDARHGGQDDGVVDTAGDSSERKGNLDMMLVLKFILILCALVFSGLILYMLMSGDMKAVQEACGGLWGLLLVRVSTSMIVGGFLMLDSWLYGNSCMGFVGPVSTVAFFLLYFLVFSIAEISIIPQAMIGNSVCTNTLSDNSPTGTPLLGVLGWINLGIDWCFVVLMGIVLLMDRCRGSSSGNDGDIRHV
jgi:hypothetical protein